MQDLKTTCFKDVSWLHVHAPLGLHNVLDYFILSPFYEKSCNNELLRMQRQYQSVSLSPQEYAAQLEGMVGIEYQVDHEYNQGLFVVHKHYRRAPTTCVLLASYYVAEGVIYPCPDLASVISSRLSTSIYFLQETLRALDVSTDERPSIHGDVKDRLEVQSSSHVTDTIKGRYEQWKRLENGEPEKFNFLLAAFASEDAAR